MIFQIPGAAATLFQFGSLSPQVSCGCVVEELKNVELKFLHTLSNKQTKITLKKRREKKEYKKNMINCIQFDFWFIAVPFFLLTRYTVNFLVCKFVFVVYMLLNNG